MGFFLTPYMLWGALAASVPLAIHLFFRSRYRTVPWAAMKFLLTSIEQTSRRLKFQELLLLLLRMSLLAMLALAFARPVTSLLRGAGRGDAVDAVFVVDVSYSMGASDGAKSRLDRLKDEAIKIVNELPAHSTVQIIASAGKSSSNLGPRSPANLDQAQELLKNLELTSLASDLHQGVTDAKEVLQHGQASNKELYVFSDMQKLGWDQQAGELKRTLEEIKEKAVVHLVRCGTREVKNAAIVDILPQTQMPQPGARVGFAVLVRNTGKKPLENLTVTLSVDGDDKNVDSNTIAKLDSRETRAVTLFVSFKDAGMHVLTARVKPDELEGDNRFDQVILVRDQINVLVVDGNYYEKDKERASSYFVQFALRNLVHEPERSVVPADQATPALLNKQDICILINVGLKNKSVLRRDAPPADFIEALGAFVRKGHSLLIFSGDNVQADDYNQIIGKKLGILPLPINARVKAPAKEPFRINRDTFGNGPPAFHLFKEDKFYEGFNKVEVWQYVDLDEKQPVDIEKLRYRYYRPTGATLPDFSKLKAEDEGDLPQGLFDLGPRKHTTDFGFVFEGTLNVPAAGDYTFFLDSADGAQLSVSGTPIITYDGLHDMGTGENKTVTLAKGKQPIKLEYFLHNSKPGLAVAWEGPGFVKRSLSVGKQENPLTVIGRFSNNKPFAVTRKIDGGEVMFVATSAHPEGIDKKTGNPAWSDFATSLQFIPFLDKSLKHLLQGQLQTYNLVAGETMTWYPKDKLDNIYSLLHPNNKMERLKPPEKVGQRVVVTATDLPRAGIYRLTSMPRGSETSTTTEALDALKSGTPIAVVPDPRESDDLQTLGDAEIDTKLGFQPIHIVAGDANTASTGADRLNREWTVWALLAVLAMVLGETLLAWWCGRAW